jgi:hypothetical protein
MKVGGENIQSICYVFETQGRIVTEEVYSESEKVMIPVSKREEKIWIENAGPFNKKRNPWFKEPGRDQLKVIGSKT